VVKAKARSKSNFVTIPNILPFFYYGKRIEIVLLEQPPVHAWLSGASPSLRRASPRENDTFVNRIGWLRVAVLGANDGILSTAGLIVGVAAAADFGKLIELESRARAQFSACLP
jgi:hypothetical protein